MFFSPYTVHRVVYFKSASRGKEEQGMFEIGRIAGDTPTR